MLEAHNVDNACLCGSEEKGLDYDQFSDYGLLRKPTP